MINSTISSIKDRAMLVRLAISEWTARKFDRKVSEDVAQRNRIVGGSEEAGRFNKLLIAKDTLAHVVQIDGAARTFHYASTLPWSDEGTRLLPSAMFFDYTTRMKEFADERKDAVKTFIKSYPELVVSAKKRLNALWKEEDYPSVEEVKQKFAFDYSFLPLPDAKDFRVSIDEQMLKEVQEDIERRTEEAVEGSQRELWVRLHSAVEHLVERLKKFDPEKGIKGNPFRDSLVENVRELVDAMPKMNFAQNQELNRMARRLKSELCKVGADQLRGDEEARGKTVKTAEKILRDMGGYIG